MHLSFIIHIVFEQSSNIVCLKNLSNCGCIVGSNAWILGVTEAASAGIAGSLSIAAVKIKCESTIQQETESRANPITPFA
jgi:hypothetical protein